ncbi:hypothetical protein WSM22_03670 [Cytophagales bacterium WSM2-2]|nr:hypothetical protein WSM22_03670 [Cytophagales bacterium WSM2-2]
MNRNILISIIACTAVISACDKPVGADLRPTANFVINKNKFIGGDTVHLKDSSINAYSWKWLLPDGSELYSKDVDYVIDSTSCSKTAKFKLQVFSKSKTLTDTISKSISITPKIFKTDFWTGAFTCNPTAKTITIYNEHVYISAVRILHGSWVSGIGITLGGQNLVPGVYSLQADASNLQEGYANIGIGYEDDGKSYKSMSGQLVVTILPSGQINFSFDNVAALYLDPDKFSTPVSSNISGSLTLCQ